jgi:hypothetical protein
MANQPGTRTPGTSAAIPAETRFVNAMRLTGRNWLGVLGVTALLLLGTPWLWKKLERFETGPDYRSPYALSKDYWLYQRRLEGLAPAPDHIVVLGDSVVWGEYVRPEGTLTHFLNEQSGQKEQFVNAGVNGLFPLAGEGLIRHYGGALRQRKVIVHDNLLWLTSPKADLRTEKEDRFNHAELVPQFSPRIPCYKADLNHRLTAVVERNFPFSQWASHLQLAYFGQKNVLSWTLEEDSSSPPRYPNAYKNPLKQITLSVPPESSNDPERGPNSPRHKPWSTTGEGSTRFEWVTLEESLQWAAFQRLVTLLQSRGNDVLVLLGPFNEHIMVQENRATFRHLRDGMAGWFQANNVAYVMPETLPSALYADASHPLTEGYRLLAEHLRSAPSFQQWMDKSRK